MLHKPFRRTALPWAIALCMAMPGVPNGAWAGQVHTYKEWAFSTYSDPMTDSIMRIAWVDSASDRFEMICYSDFPTIDMRWIVDEHEGFQALRSIINSGNDIFVNVEYRFDRRPARFDQWSYNDQNRYFYLLNQQKVARFALDMMRGRTLLIRGYGITRRFSLMGAAKALSRFARACHISWHRLVAAKD